MINLSIGVVLFIVIALMAVIVVIERKRINDGIVISSHYPKIFVTGASVTVAGILAMVLFYFIEVPVLFGFPVMTMGLGYLSAGFVYRREWLKWVHSYAELERKYIIPDRG